MTLSIFDRRGSSAREVAHAAMAKAADWRLAIVLGIHDDGSVQLSPAIKKEGERLAASDAFVWTVNAQTQYEELHEAVSDRIFAIIRQRMREAA